MNSNPLFLILIALIVFASAISAAADTPTTATENILYTQDFQDEPTGEYPLDFLVLKGDFEVIELDSEKFLRLPGAPLDRFEVVFGPNHSENVELRAAVRSERSGRRYPEIAIGLGGARGYRAQLAPARGAFELILNDKPVGSLPYTWPGDSWQMISIGIRKLETQWQITVSTWQKDSKSKKLTIVHSTESEPVKGQPILAASPYSGKPIDFDDIKLIDIKDDPDK